MELIKILRESIQMKKFLRSRAGIDIDKTSLFNDTMKDIVKAYEACDDFEDRDCAIDKAVLYFALSKWMNDKVVYHMNGNILKYTSDPESSRLDLAKLCMIGRSAFFVSCPKDNLCGYFIYIEPWNVGDCMIIAIEVKDQQGVGSTSYNLWVRNGETPLEALTRTKKKVKEQGCSEGSGVIMSTENFDTDSPAWDNVTRYYEKHISNAIRLIYYIVDHEGSIETVRRSKKQRPRMKDGTPLNIQSFIVPYDPPRRADEADKPLMASLEHLKRAPWKANIPSWLLPQEEAI